jgi:predicted NBD/HSP70 family sugar kinase
MSPAFEAILNRDWLKEQSVSLETVAEVLARVVAARPDPVPRVDIADGTMLTDAPKLPHGSVSRASNVLLRLNMVQEQHAVSERPGRPIVPLRLSKDWALAGVQVSRAAGKPPEAVGMLMALDGTPSGSQISQQVRWPFHENDVLDAVTEVAEKLRKQHTTSLFGVGVGVGGGILERMANLGHTRLLRDALTQRLGMPTVVESAVDTHAVRASWLRDPKSKKLRSPQAHFAVVGLYHDRVSSALVINRKLHRGDHGLAGGIGHLTVDFRPPAETRSGRDEPGFYDPCSCGRPYGHLEALATPARIAGQTGMAFEQAARQPYNEDSPITGAFATAGDALGRGISAMLDITNPGQLLLLLPKAITKAAEGSAAAAYKVAVYAAVRLYSYSAGHQGDQDVLLIEAMDPDDVLLGTQAAATCVLDSFISYARGE